MRRGFTLIELLVVISIIALLSSVVLASLNSARDKGRIAAGRQFSGIVDHATGDYAVGIYDFDECSGTSAGDRSGNGNHGTLVNGATFSTNTQTGAGCSVSMTAGGQDVRLSPLATLQSPDITYVAWIYPTDTTSLKTVISKEMQYKYRISSGQLASLASCTGSGWTSGLTGGTIQTNKWQFVVMTVDSTNQKAALYIDGALVASGGTSCPITGYNSNVICVGSYDCNGSEQFLGNIDSARVYAKALTAREIGRMYALESSRYENIASTK